jgi:hypothetical protein
MRHGREGRRAALMWWRRYLRAYVAPKLAADGDGCRFVHLFQIARWRT